MKLLLSALYPRKNIIAASHLVLILLQYNTRGETVLSIGTIHWSKGIFTRNNESTEEVCARAWGTSPTQLKVGEVGYVVNFWTVIRKIQIHNDETFWPSVCGCMLISVCVSWWTQKSNYLYYVSRKFKAWELLFFQYFLLSLASKLYELFLCGDSCNSVLNKKLLF